jgi:hypothetical protein
MMDDSLPPTLVSDWAGLLAGPHSSDAVFDHPVLFPLQRKSELRRMLQAAGSPTVVMEIGADKGGGLYHWCTIPSVKAVVACEIRGTPYSAVFEAAFPHIDFLWLPYSSLIPETVERVESWLGGRKINTLFIDGDKSYFDKDYGLYSPFVDGTVFFHDIQDESTGAAWQRVKRTVDASRCSEILDVSDWQSTSHPPRTCHEGWLQYWKGASCGVGVIKL